MEIKHLVLPNWAAAHTHPDCHLSPESLGKQSPWQTDPWSGLIQAKAGTGRAKPSYLDDGVGGILLQDLQNFWVTNGPQGLP